AVIDILHLPGGGDSSRGSAPRCRFAVHRPGSPVASPRSHGMPCRCSCQVVHVPAWLSQTCSIIPLSGGRERRFCPARRPGRHAAILMTPESTRASETESVDAQRHPCPTRRGALLGVGLAGLGGALAGCSTAAVPYDANEAGVAPGGQAQGAMPNSGAVSSPGGGMSSSGASGAMSGQGGMLQPASAPPSPASGLPSSKPKKDAKITGT